MINKKLFFVRFVFIGSERAKRNKKSKKRQAECFLLSLQLKEKWNNFVYESINHWTGSRVAFKLASRKRDLPDKQWQFIYSLTLHFVIRMDVFTAKKSEMIDLIPWQIFDKY